MQPLTLVGEKSSPSQRQRQIQRLLQDKDKYKDSYKDKDKYRDIYKDKDKYKDSYKDKYKDKDKCV